MKGSPDPLTLGGGLVTLALAALLGADAAGELASWASWLGVIALAVVGALLVATGLARRGGT